MNKKIIIIISVMILLVSIFGLLTSQENSSSKASQLPEPPKKVSYSFLVASRDLFAGEIIDSSDITIETKEEDAGKDYGDMIINQSKDFITDAIALTSIKKGEIISNAYVAKAGSKAYEKLKSDAKNGLFSFGFDLEKREYSILSKIKPNQSVDIYFKYETRNKKTNPVLPKRNPNQQYSSEGNASSANLVLMFSNKRVLFMEKIPPKQDEKTAQQAVAMLHIELSQEEIKEIYAIEDLGVFVIFPSNKNTQNDIATENILTKDFIKELKGGADAKSDTY